MAGCGKKFLTGKKEIRTIKTDLETGEKTYTYNHRYFRICGNNFANALCKNCSLNLKNPSKEDEDV